MYASFYISGVIQYLMYSQLLETYLPVTVLGGSLELVAILMEDTVCYLFNMCFLVSSPSVCTVVITHAQCDGEVAIVKT